MLIQAWDPGSSKRDDNCAVTTHDSARVTALDAGGDDLLDAVSIDGRSLAAIARQVKRAKQLGATIVIERQFPGGRSGANPMDLERVILTRGMVLAVAEMVGVPVVQVFPSTWQSVVLRVVPLLPEISKVSEKTGRARHDTKKAVAWLVDRLYPGRLRNKDERDAAAIGRWGCFTQDPAAPALPPKPEAPKKPRAKKPPRAKARAA
jgi:hypothetical protein